MKLTNEIPSAQGADPVFEKHGSPFLVYGKGKVALNDRAVAAKCAAKHMLKYDSKLLCRNHLISGASVKG